MQTNFTLAQLADPGTAESERILRKCVHCGFCTATCPTYLLLGDELDSPRGRIYLIKEMLEKGCPADERTVKHIDRCLSCLACMTTCPSGVHYMHLVDHARAYIEKTYRRPFADRFIRKLLATVLPNPELMKLALSTARLARPLRGIVKGLPQGDRLAAMLGLAAFRGSRRINDPLPSVTRPAKSRVAVLQGCAQRVLEPSINGAASRVLARHGIETVPVPQESCCGAIVYHMGQEKAGRNFAKNNIDAWLNAIDKGGIEAILVTASGCGTTIKDYGQMFREDRHYAEKARRISAIAKDIAEYLSDLPLVAPL